MENSVKERYGSLKKIEPLRLIEDDAVLKNTLAFECPEPFPGYYGVHKGQTTPLFIYLVINDYMNMEDFLHMNSHVSAFFDKNYNATLATIGVFDETYHAIRINQIDDYAAIKKIQELFVKEGLEFHRFTRRYKTIDQGLIRIKKFFHFLQVEEGYCFDQVDDYHGYFCISEHMNLERFAKIIKQVDQNIDLIDFDAALASYYEDYKVHDMVRIYTEELSVDLLKKIKKEFLSQLAKPI